MIPNVTRGGNTRGVLLYLVGPGKREEHHDPHLVAGAPETLRIAGEGLLGAGDAAALARFLDEPREDFGTRVTIAKRDGNGRTIGTREAHVWHCSLSLHPDEPDLSDERWSEISDQFVAAMGFAGGDARAQCRWVAIRHGQSGGGSDHAHIVVGLVAEDGSRASVHNDRPRAQRAARKLEERFGLRQLEARARGTGSRGIRPGERMADTRRKRDHGLDGREPERGSRQTLERVVRGCATASRNESEFVRALREHDVRVRPRYAEGGRSQVVGYSVRLPGPVVGHDRAVWFGGGRLARDLTLPSLRVAWQQDAGEEAAAVKEWSSSPGTPARSEDERRAEVRERALVWHRCVGEIERLRGQLRGVDNDPVGAARVARDGAGVLAAWSLALEGDAPGPLARAARQLARSAEHPAHRRTPPPRARPRSSALALFLLAGARPDSAAGWFLLARQLSLLGRDLARLHELRGELDRAREIKTGLGAELEFVRTGLVAGSGPGSPAEPEAAAELRPVRDPIPGPRPGAQSHGHEAEAARRLSDATRRRPRRQR